MTDRHYFLVAVVFYGISTLYAVFLWRRGFRRDDRVSLFLLLGGLAFHITAMMMRGVSFARCPVSNLFEASMFVGWAMAVAAVVTGLVPRFGFVPVVASPVLFGLGVFGLMPPLDATIAEPPIWKGLASLHASLTLLAYGALGLAALAAAMFLMQEHDLKHRKMRAFAAFIPSIQRLEKVSWRLLLAGFGLLTVGLMMGAGWLRHDKGSVFQPDAKVVWSVVVWVAYLAMILLRWRAARGGRRFAWSVVGAFAFVMLTFWGTNLLSPIHNP